MSKNNSYTSPSQPVSLGPSNNERGQGREARRERNRVIDRFPFS